jgi:hypothetical protein
MALIQAPTICHELLDAGIYLASISTMYRILHAHDEVHERRRQATHSARVKPELVATRPNRCWSWDITMLAGPAWPGGVCSTSSKASSTIICSARTMSGRAVTRPRSTSGFSFSVRYSYWSVSH